MTDKKGLKCKCDKKHKVAEREFVNGKVRIIGTRLICLKCGENKFIKD